LATGIDARAALIAALVAAACQGVPATAPAAATADLEGAPRVSWTAATGGVWSDAGNWSGGAVPGEGDHVVIDLDGSYTVTLDGDARIAGLTLGAARGTQTLVVPRDAIALSSPGTVGPGAVLELAGGRIGGDGDLVVHGRVVWSGGAMTGRGKTRIAAGGRLEIVGDQRKVLSLRHIENAGSMVWHDRGDLMVTFAAQIRNLEGGAFEVASGALLDVYGPAGPAVDNAGTLHVAAAGTTTFETPLTNSGTVEIAAGGLRLPAGYTQTAGVTRLDAALLAAQEILIGGGELVGEGTLEGTVTNAGRIEAIDGEVAFDESLVNQASTGNIVGRDAILRFDPEAEAFTSFRLPTRGAQVRQILGRPGEVWLPESATDMLAVICDPCRFRPGAGAP